MATIASAGTKRAADDSSQSQRELKKSAPDCSIEGSSVSTEAGFKLRPSFLKAPEIKSSPPTSTAEAESGRLVDKSIAIAGFSSSRGETAFSLGFGGVGDEVALNSRPGQVKPLALFPEFSGIPTANTAQGKGTHKQNVFGSNLKDKITKDSFYSPPLILTPASSSGPTLPDSESQWEEKISLVKSSDSIFGAMLANKIRAGMSGPFSGLGDKVTAEEQQGDPPSGPKLSDEATLSDKDCQNEEGDIDGSEELKCGVDKVCNNDTVAVPKVFGRSDSPDPLSRGNFQHSTGEENDKLIVVMSAKLFVFHKETQTWVDRGRGIVSLNDVCQSSSEGIYQSRIVMRAHGSRRLLLNAGMWAEMICERASVKSVRFTGQDLEGEAIKIYLLTGDAKHIGNLFDAMEKRLLVMKRAQDRVSDDEVRISEGELSKTSLPASPSEIASLKEENAVKTDYKVLTMSSESSESSNSNT